MRSFFYLSEIYFIPKCLGKIKKKLNYFFLTTSISSMIKPHLLMERSDLKATLIVSPRRIENCSFHLFQRFSQLFSLSRHHQKVIIFFKLIFLNFNSNKLGTWITKSPFHFCVIAIRVLTFKLLYLNRLPIFWFRLIFRPRIGQ